MGTTQNRFRSYSSKVRSLLWGLSAGRCNFPNCNIKLIVPSDGVSNIAHIGEMAHIVDSSSKFGRRIDPSLPENQRDEYDNLILLCPNHHTLIDKQPNSYPISLLQEMKRNHERYVEASLNPPISRLYGVPARVGNFVGHDELLSHIESIFQNASKPTRLALTGIPGIGKTSIATMLARNLAGRVFPMGVFWFNANMGVEEQLESLILMAGLPNTGTSHTWKEMVNAYGRSALVVIDGVVDKIHDFNKIPADCHLLYRSGMMVSNNGHRTFGKAEMASRIQPHPSRDKIF